MVNITNATINATPTEELIDLYNGGILPHEISFFVFFVIFGVIAAIWFAYMIFSSENN